MAPQLRRSLAHRRHTRLRIGCWINTSAVDVAAMVAAADLGGRIDDGV
jgi:hypothetical protein